MSLWIQRKGTIMSILQYKIEDSMNQLCMKNLQAYLKCTTLDARANHMSWGWVNLLTIFVLRKDKVNWRWLDRCKQRDVQSRVIILRLLRALQITRSGHSTHRTQLIQLRKKCFLLPVR